MIMQKYLITGFSGFVGYHFLHFLDSVLSENTDVLGIDLYPPNDFETASYKFKKLNVTFRSLNILDYDLLKEIICSFFPTRIIHLAALSSVSESWNEPVKCFLNNTNIFLNLVDIIRTNKINCRILSVGSSEEYGNVDISSIPLHENNELKPVSPYAIARVSQEMLASYYVRTFNLDIILTRSFNHIGTRQRDTFVIPSIIKQFVVGKNEGKKCIELFMGDVSIIRDFIDVRDVVKAYYLLFEKGVKGEVYNICSGKGETLEDIIYKIAKVLNVEVKIITCQEKVRPNDNKVIIGSYQKMKECTGWEPAITLEKSFKDIIEYWQFK
jgi:GDP-4-dehydro-6-deoxy-D-mannose reductase